MSESFTQFAANTTNFGELQQKKFIPNPGEGLLYFKFVALTPQTIEINTNLEGLVETKPGFIFAGSLDDIKAKLNEYFDQMAEAYEQSANEFREGNK
jgi:hypothetical protein